MKTIYADKYRQIGLKIAYYRKLRGLTQEQLAERLELSPAFIGHVEAPNINKAVSLAYGVYASSSSSSSGYRAAISHRPSSSCFAPVLYSE